jgi:hypothetical protein
MRVTGRSSVVRSVGLAVLVWFGCGDSGGKTSPEAGPGDGAAVATSEVMSAVEAAPPSDAPRGSDGPAAAGTDAATSVGDGAATGGFDGASPGADAAITAADPACAMVCAIDGGPCIYPTGACGTATCADGTFQAAGVCAAGTCVVPAAVSCPFACSVAAGGCTGTCRPAQRTCLSSTTPEFCDVNGVWQVRAACPSGSPCTDGACACSPGWADCGSGCVDLNSDDANCGACGNNCAALCEGCFCSQGGCDH